VVNPPGSSEMVMQSQRDWIVTLVLIVSATLLGGATAQAGSKSSADKLNKKIDNVAFKTGAGKTFALTDLKDKKAIVAVFLSFDCPVSTSYAQTLAVSPSWALFAATTWMQARLPGGHANTRFRSLS